MWMRLFAVLMAASFLRALSAEETLPQRAAGEVPEGAPQLFLDDLGEVLPSAGAEAPPTEPEAAATVESARTALARARRKQTRWQRLAKAGVLSAVEAESCTLQVSRAALKYEEACLALRRQQLAAIQRRAASEAVSPDLLAAAEAAVATSETLAAEAAAGWQRTQRLQAEANLERQRRLVAAGVGSRRQLQRAETALQQLPALPASR